MSKLARDLALPGYGGALPTLHPRESLWTSGNLSVVAAELGLAVDGCSTVAFSLLGTFVASFVAEGSLDGTNWISVPVKIINLGGTWTLTVTNTSGTYFQAKVGPFRFFRVRCTAWTSGTANVLIVAENGLSDVIARPKASDLSVTNTGVSGAAVTLTLPAVGGLFHFIDRIIIQRFAVAALTAGATPVLGTTTNLPGSRVFSFPADAALQGTIATEVFEPARPHRSSTAGIATTIVLPATTSVIWRVTADYDLDLAA